MRRDVYSTGQVQLAKVDVVVMLVREDGIVVWCESLVVYLLSFQMTCVDRSVYRERHNV